MTNYMFVLRPTTKKFKTVCPACAKRGEVLSSCPVCHGCAIKCVSVKQYYVQDTPVNIIKVDRDPATEFYAIGIVFVSSFMRQFIQS